MISAETYAPFSACKKRDRVSASQAYSTWPRGLWIPESDWPRCFWRGKHFKKCFNLHKAWCLNPLGSRGFLCGYPVIMDKVMSDWLSLTLGSSGAEKRHWPCLCNEDPPESWHAGKRTGSPATVQAVCQLYLANIFEFTSKHPSLPLRLVTSGLSGTSW